MNLYIALLSETFARVYQNAKANAALLQATTILQVEKALSKKRKNLAEKFIQKECCPMVSQAVLCHVLRTLCINAMQCMIKDIGC